MRKSSTARESDIQPTLLQVNDQEAAEAVLPVFARHETFHPRYGWLKKGMDLAAEDSGAFSSNDALVRLGVGKNMVNAIRYWCQAFKVIEPVDGSGRSREYKPSDPGRGLLDDDSGLDPYLEDTGSLWLLHWRLLQPPCYAAAWYYTFFLFSKVEYTIDELFLAMSQWARARFPSSRLADSSLKKDAACVVRMYTDGDSSEVSDIEPISSPFAVLRLLEKSGSSSRYYFNIGPKPNLPAEIIAVACLDFMSSDPSRSAITSDGARGASTKSFSSLLYDEGSPGLAFKLTESALYDALDRVSHVYRSLGIQDRAGILQVACKEPPSALSSRILQDYYSRR